MPKVYNVQTKFPPSAILVDRSTPWGNPFHMDHGENSRFRVCADHELWLNWWIVSGREVQIPAGARMLNNKWVVEHLGELRGKDLVCHCAPKPCHADLLLRLANGLYSTEK